MITKITLLAFTILLYSTSVHAQNTGLSVNDSTAQIDSPSLEGAITTEDGVLTVTFGRVVGDSLLIVDRSSAHVISITSIHSIKIYTNETSVVSGAAIGAVVGGVSGGIIGGATYEEPPPTPGTFNFNMSGLDRSLDIAVGAIAGGVIGGVIGGMIGYADKKGDVHDLTSMSLPAKVKLIQFLLERKP